MTRQLMRTLARTIGSGQPLLTKAKAAASTPIALAKSATRTGAFGLIESPEERRLHAAWADDRIFKEQYVALKSSATKAATVSATWAA